MYTYFLGNLFTGGGGIAFGTTNILGGTEGGGFPGDMEERFDITTVVLGFGRVIFRFAEGLLGSVTSSVPPPT
jgi:hypothetical protein